MSMFAGFGMGQSYALDSVGTFFQSELTRLDPELHKPLVSVTWSRDLPLRSDVSVGDEFSAFLRMKMGSVGGLRSDGINWVGTESTALPAATVDNERIVYPLRLWGSVVEYTVQEVERSQRLGRPIDVQKIESMHLKNQMDTDHMAYVGDQSAFPESFGLLNSTDPQSVIVQQETTFSALAAQEGGAAAIQQALLNAQAAVWKQSGFAVCPNKLLLPPEVYGLLNRTVSSAGMQSIMQFLKVNNAYTQQTGEELDIQPVKWLSAGNTYLNNSGKARAVFYTDEEKYVRYPVTPLQKTAVTYQDLWLRVAYWCLLGHVELVYPETVGYLDGV